jgi:hypothetical protein
LVINGSKTAVMDVIGFLCVSLGSNTVQLHDSLGSRWVFSEDGSTSHNGHSALGVYYGRAVICCAFVCGQKDSMQRVLIKKYFLFTVGSVCRVKLFTTGSTNFLKDVRKSQMVPDQVRKWLRQQSKDFYAGGFEAC